MSISSYFRSDNSLRFKIVASQASMTLSSRANHIAARDQSRAEQKCRKLAQVLLDLVSSI